MKPKIKKKLCTECGEYKSVKMFYKDSRNADGYRSYCKQCVISKNLEYRRNKPKKKEEAIAKMRLKYFS